MNVQTRGHTFLDTYSIIPEKMGSEFTEKLNKIVT